MRRPARIALGCSLALLCGCAAFSAKDDYADYRRIRMAPDEEQRLIAMRQYLGSQPDGQWHEQIERELEQRDAEIFETYKTDRAGLKFYLEAFPEGQFTKQARARLAALAKIEARRRAKARRAAEIKAARLARERELRRTWVTRFFGYWTQTLLGIDNWGAPIPKVARANPGFSRAFGHAPRPRCSREECVKYYTSAYGVPVPGGTRVERTLQLILRLRIEDTHLVGAELLMPGGGFSRWYEVEQREMVVDADPDSRAKAVRWALGKIENMLSQATEAEPLASYALPDIPKPDFDFEGELTDVTAESPEQAPRVRTESGTETQASEQAQRQADEALQRAVSDEPTNEELADMVLSPMQVGGAGSGRTLEQGGETPETGESEDESMVVGPIQVGGEGEGGSAPPEPAPSGASTGGATTPTVEAFEVGDLVVAAFAAAGRGEGPPYDGLLVRARSTTEAENEKSPKLGEAAPQTDESSVQPR